MAGLLGAPSKPASPCPHTASPAGRQSLQRGTEPFLRHPGPTQAVRALFLLPCLPPGWAGGWPLSPHLLPFPTKRLQPARRPINTQSLRVRGW